MSHRRNIFVFWKRRYHFLDTCPSPWKIFFICLSTFCIPHFCDPTSTALFTKSYYYYYHYFSAMFNVYDLWQKQQHKSTSLFWSSLPVSSSLFWSLTAATATWEIYEGLTSIIILTQTVLTTVFSCLRICCVSWLQWDYYFVSNKVYQLFEYKGVF